MKLSVLEYNILRSLSSEWKYIIRDYNRENQTDELYLFSEKPYKVGNDWCVDIGDTYDNLIVDNNLFTFIKLNDEPYSIEEMIKEYERKGN